jgi:hypothetical protein
MGNRLATLLPSRRVDRCCWATLPGVAYCWVVTIALSLVTSPRRRGCLASVLYWLKEGGYVTSPRESTEFAQPPTSCCAIHVTLLPSKGCSSPNSLTVPPLFQLFCWQCLCGVPSIASAPFSSGARLEHLHDPAFVDPLFRIHASHSFSPHSLWGGWCFYITGSSSA